MLKKEIADILSASRQQGWVLEPEAKRVLSLAGLKVPRFTWTAEVEEAVRFAGEMDYPVVAKIVSSEVIHKSDLGGVVTGIDSQAKLRETFRLFSKLPGFAGILVEEMISGLELIVGGKIDYQFGPVILLGVGGTGVEIYRDTSLRMAPLDQSGVEFMVKGLQARRLLEGYRGSEPVNLHELTRLMLTFSDLIMELEGLIESVDLNPVMCSANNCVVADARIILNTD